VDGRVSKIDQVKGYVWKDNQLRCLRIALSWSLYQTYPFTCSIFRTCMFTWSIFSWRDRCYKILRQYYEHEVETLMLSLIIRQLNEKETKMARIWCLTRTETSEGSSLLKWWDAKRSRPTVYISSSADCHPSVAGPLSSGSLPIRLCWRVSVEVESQRPTARDQMPVGKSCFANAILLCSFWWKHEGRASSLLEQPFSDDLGWTWWWPRAVYQIKLRPILFFRREIFRSSKQTLSD